MSDFKQQENTGTAFRNDKKGNDKAPDWKGTVNVNGVELELAIWERTSKTGKEMLSAKVQPKFVKDQNKAVVPQYKNANEDLPF